MQKQDDNELLQNCTVCIIPFIVSLYTNYKDCQEFRLTISLCKLLKIIL